MALASDLSSTTALNDSISLGEDRGSEGRETLEGSIRFKGWGVGV